MSEPIAVNRPYLPPMSEYIGYLEGIWSRGQLTNHGPLLAELEQVIQQAQELSMPVRATANGGLGLQLLIKALGVRGEIITTPFSYVATASCSAWEGCALRYADIEPEALTLDAEAVEAAITPSTEAIVATHVYGNPCDCEKLEGVARKHGIALIFDAAHAYGVRYQGKSILEYGDGSMVSLHATKLLQSVEGGFVVAQNAAVSDRVEWMRRFGHKGHDAYHGVGINAKMSELHAAMGLCVHRHLDDILAARHALCEAYDQALEEVGGITKAFVLRDSTQWNASYYPIRFETEAMLEEMMKKLEDAGVFPRRYFHPALNEADALGQEKTGCPVAEAASREVLCLPLGAQMSEENIARVVSTLTR
ncbi:MAG: DegT/DnrJ/EryC1/StrS family aminotransferase [Luteolibacter sp.]